MARRINIYVLLRSVHLYSAAVAGTFLLMYFITGFLLVRYQWFSHNEPEVITTEKEIYVEGNISKKKMVSLLRDQLGIKGQLTDYIEQKNGDLEIWFLKPGLRTTITIAPDLKKARIEQNGHDFHRFITAFHRMHLYGGGFIYDIFMVMMDLASLSLIIFSITGIYLWFKILQNKIWGIVFLVLGLSYTIWVIISLTT